MSLKVEHQLYVKMSFWLGRLGLTHRVSQNAVTLGNTG